MCIVSLEEHWNLIQFNDKQRKLSLKQKIFIKLNQAQSIWKQMHLKMWNWKQKCYNSPLNPQVKQRSDKLCSWVFIRKREHVRVSASLTLLVRRYSRGTSEAHFKKRQLRSVRCWVILVFREGMLLDRQALESDNASEIEQNTSKCKR